MVKKFSKNDEGVSAVIGVILMVAITVILAAVIAAFVFSMSNNVGTTHTVALTVKKSSAGNLVVTNNGGADVSKLDAITITTSTSLGTVTICEKNVDMAEVGDSKTILKFGETYPTGATSYTDLDSATQSYKVLPDLGTGETMYHVIITGVFSDSTSQVLIEADV